MPAKYANNARSKLFSGINSSALNFSLISGGGASFPAAGGSDYFYATLIDAENIPEIVKVTSRTDDSFIVLRGQDGTVARAFAANAEVILGITKASLEELALKDGSNASGTWPIAITGAAGGSITKKGGNTGSAVMPAGATSERPTSPEFGEQRANTSTQQMEWWSGFAWAPLGLQPGNRNKLINGNFGVNQRVVSGTVTLAANAYGHDYWKAGASGCTYTFATVNNVTTITITAGSLTQIINGKNLFTGTHVLSWGGTAKGRINGGAPGDSGMTAAITGGTNTTIEFGAGTLSLAQFEPGSTPTTFEFRLNELQLCQQRYFKTYDQAVAPASISNFNAAISITAMGPCNYLSMQLSFPVTMEAIPECTVYGPNDGIVGRMSRDATWISGAAVGISQRGCTIRAANQPVVADNFVSAHLVAVAGL